jgi:osmoprotectant transport system permease protein
MRTFVDAFRFIGDHPHLLLVKSSQTLELAAAALGIALLLALPIGLWLGHLHRGLFAAASVSNVGRALPSLVLIAFGLTVFGIGFWNNTVALVVLAIPPVLTNAYFAVDGVDRDVVDAARGMGMTEAQVLRRVELPLALPLILAGVRISAIFVIATATIAALAGGGGLGDVIVNRATYGNAGVVAASLCVSALAFAASLIVSFVKRAGSPRPTLVP